MSRLSLDISVELGEFSLAVACELELSGITVVFGPSGSGKTTLLRTIAGLEKHARGRVAFTGTAWQDGSTVVGAHSRRIGYVFQEGRLFPHLTVLGNLEFAARFAGRSPDVSLEDAVAAFDLGPLLDRATATLSGGERQRVAIARALVRNPALLIMDEPLSSLDAARKQSMIRYIDQLPERFGLPILYVTHDIDEVVRLADQVLLLNKGAIEATGTAREIMERDDFHLVAGLRDPGSLVEARVVAQEPRATVLAIGDQQIRLPSVEIAPGAAVRLRVHARDVVVAVRRPEQISIRNVLSGEVVSLREHSAALCDVAIAVEDQKVVARITLDAAQDLALAPGQPVFALIKSVALDEHPLA